MNFWFVFWSTIILFAISLITTIVLIVLKKYFQLQVAFMITTLILALMSGSMYIAREASDVEPSYQTAYQIDTLTSQYVIIKGTKYDLNDKYITVTKDSATAMNPEIKNEAVVVPTSVNIKWFGITLIEDYVRITIVLDEETYDKWTAADKNQNVLIYNKP
jgi:hypothetical protein